MQGSGPTPLIQVPCTSWILSLRQHVRLGDVAVCITLHDERQGKISTYSGMTVTKEELRAELERQAERYKEVYGGEVTTYAAQLEPERKPWRKRATVQDQVFAQELEKMEKELRSENT